MAGSSDKTETKREAALLSWIQQYAPYGIMTLDTELRVQTWNHWMEVHSGLPLSQVAGKNLLELFPDLRERRLLLCFQQALQGESSVLSTGFHHYLLPLPAVFREFGLLNMLQTARVAPLFAGDAVCGVVAVIEDVTQREGQAEALRRQHRRDEILAWALALLLKTEEPQKAVRQLFFKVAEHMDFDLFCLYLADGRSGAMTLTTHGGIPDKAEREFERCPFQAVVPAGSSDAVVVNGIREREQPGFGPLRSAGIRAAAILPLVGAENQLGLLCFATSSREKISQEEVDLLTTISRCLATSLDREHANQQLQSAKEELGHYAVLLEKTVRERTSRLQETVAELETFSYALAHDLREPVRGLTGFCEVLLEDFEKDLPLEAKRIVQRLARAARRMEALTRDLLAFSRVSTEKIALSPVDVGAIIEDLTSVRAPAVREAIRVKAPLLPVRGQAALLQQALSNLVDNAVKFVAARQKPAITIWTERVEESSPSTRTHALSFGSVKSAGSESPSAPDTTKAGRVRIWVADEGIGIPREVHPKIFGIFERAVTAEQYDGTGIGLAIVARAMQRLGGACGVESEPGKGSRFWLELPGA